LTLARAGAYDFVMHTPRAYRHTRAYPLTGWVGGVRG